ncbi:hypothetical protein R6Q59_007158 [Mikania micrantha]
MAIVFIGQMQLRDSQTWLFDVLMLFMKLIGAQIDQCNSEGTVITTVTEHDLEKEALKSVCSKQKTLQSAREVGVGPVLRKKDSWMKSNAESSHQDSSHTNEDLRKHVIALKNKFKHSNEKYKRISEFIITKFPEFKNILATPATHETHYSEGQSNDSYDTT